MQDADNKVRYAMIKYKNEGKYIEEILLWENSIEMPNY
jgi:hypothetical protein